MSSDTGFVTVDDMEIGLRATHRVTVDQPMIDAYAELTQDFNPIHTDAGYARTTPFGTTIAHGMLTAAFIQHPLTSLVTPGGISTEYHVRLVGPVPAGIEVEAYAECVSIDAVRRRATFRVGVVDLAEPVRPLIEGTAEISFPRSP